MVMQPFNPTSFIAQVTAYLDEHDPTPELNCLRLVVLCGIRPQQLVSLHTSQVDINDAAITEPVRAFFHRVGPKGAGYYFPAGTSHTTLGGVQEAWKQMCAGADIQGPNGSVPNLRLLASTAIQVLSASARK